MKYTFEKAEKSTVKATITLTEKEWQDANIQAYNKTKGKFNIPGFRKGKAPMSYIVKMYGEGVFFEDAANIALSKYYVEMLEKEPSIEDIDQPDVSLGNAKKGISFDLVIPVKPEVKLGDYKGLNIEKVTYTVTEEDVSADLEKLQQRNSREVAVADRNAQNGDIANIDYCGKKDGVAFEGGTANGYDLVLGSNSFIPGFEDGVVGMAIGEEKDITLKFPEDYHAEDLKGQEVVFSVKLNALKVKEIPELTDEFIKEATGEENLEEYKAQVIKKLTEEKNKKADLETEDKLIKAICDGTEIDIPDCMVSRQVDQYVNEMQYRMMYQGLKLEDYLKFIGQTMEQFRDGYKEPALSRVKQQLVVEAIIKAEGFTATEEEIQAKIADQAKEVGKELEEYKKNMDPRQNEYIANSIVVEKLFAFLKENNNIN